MPVEGGRRPTPPDFGALQGTGYGNFSRLYLGVTDPEGVTVAPEFLQAFVLEMDRPEYAFLLGARLCCAGASLAAVAAQSGFGQLFNPAGSSQLVVVDLITYDDSVADVANLSLSAAAAGAVTAPTLPTDTRWRPVFGASRNTGAEFRTGTSAAAFGTVADIQVVPANVSARFPGPFVLAPGTGVHVMGTNVNAIARVSFRWRERRLRDGEF